MQAILVEDFCQIVEEFVETSFFKVNAFEYLTQNKGMNTIILNFLSLESLYGLTDA